MEPDDLTDDYPPARHTWRHVRTAITLTVLVAFVVGAAWYSWNSVIMADEAGDSSAPPTACPSVVASEAPPPEEIELNVYNATSRNGLAQQVAAEMRDRGFTILDVDNDPLNSTIEGSAEIRSSPDQEVAASLIAAMVPGAVIVPDERDSDSVDLVLGEEFDEITAPPEPDETVDPCGEDV